MGFKRSIGSFCVLRCSYKLLMKNIPFDNAFHTSNLVDIVIMHRLKVD
jgi:hypothetical protein